MQSENINENLKMSEGDSDVSMAFTPPEIKSEDEAEDETVSYLVPEKSKTIYGNCYQQFKDWCHRKNAEFVSEKVLLGYLMEKSETVKSSSLWSIYSMLKCMLNIKEGVDITKYTKVVRYLKKKSVGYTVERSKALTHDQIKRFLEEADNEKYLLWKVILIMGISGAMRRNELTNMALDDIEERTDVLIVTVPDTKTDAKRTFTITNPDYLRFYRRYIALRPKHVTNRRLFLKYEPGKCYCQVVGVHTMGKIPSLIASYLDLPNINQYTGHCFRRSSALLTNSTPSTIVLEGITDSNSSSSKILYTKVDYKGTEILTNGITIKIPTQMFINGEFVDSETGITSNCINPTDESVICNVPEATVNDVNKAVEAAKRAFKEGEWSKISARERGLILFKLADLMQAHKEELATIETLDSGTVYSLALKTHVEMSIETWRYFAGWTDKIQGATIPISNAGSSKNLCFTKKEPIGVCGLITPWNSPLMMLSWKMAACLAAGNTVVIKPAQDCPLTALKFAELSLKAGVPPGVINVVTGSGTIVGNTIAAHPDVRKLGFTGSTEIGKVIMRTCAENVKKVSLELGGKSPLIIFADCDIEKAIKLGIESVFFNKGENNLAAGRIFVENSIYKHFIHRVTKETKKVVIGDPLNKLTTHGPQNHLAHLEKLVKYVDTAIKEGATLIHGGKRLKRAGYFFEPTILADIDDKMFVAKEESFGPIMCISKFKDGDIDGVIKRANATEYGLASGVFTSDINKALKIAERIDAGTVFINTYNKMDAGAPFGGFKQSGFGKDLGQEALNEYLKTKCVTIEY